MNAVRIGDVPLEWFTGVGNVRSHDKSCNNMTAKECLAGEVSVKKSFDREVISALRKERKHQAYLKRNGIIAPGMNMPSRCISTLDLLDPRVNKSTKK